MRGLGELVAVVHVFHTSSSLYTCICRINMGICILDAVGSYHTPGKNIYVCTYVTDMYGYTGMTGFLTFASVKLLAGEMSGGWWVEHVI